LSSAAAGCVSAGRHAARRSGFVAQKRYPII